jgi:pimeloyl-ACP methyl ester carboxylesterase
MRMPTNDTGRFYQSHDGLKLYYRDFAPEKSAVPVLCLPGLTRNSRDFEDLARRLSQNRRVLTPDLRGRGYSEHDPDWRNYRPGTYATDIWTLLDGLAIPQVIVVGTSLGGLIAMVMAVQDAKRLRGVVMNDVGPEIAPEGLARIQAYTGRLPPVASWDEAIAQTKEVYGVTLPGLTEDEWRRMARRVYREDADGVPRPDIDPAIGRAVRESGPQTRDAWQAFDALHDTPLLVIRGAMSDILAEETVVRMQERKPDLIAVTVPDRGHVPLLNEPESISAIDKFIGVCNSYA